VQRGDRVGVWSGNGAEWMITQYAAAKVGAVLVNINPAFTGKVQKFKMRELTVAELTLARVTDVEPT
jgi:fatty-acyl-CoA synthase